MVGVKNTPPTVFVILNQTKLVSAAVFVYILLGKTTTCAFFQRRCTVLNNVFGVRPVLLMGHAKNVLCLLLASTGRKQTPVQCVALTMIFAASVILTTSSSKGKDVLLAGQEGPSVDIFFGVIPILAAALLSGLGGALCQRSTMLLDKQDFQANIYRGSPNLFSLELSLYSTVTLVVTSILQRFVWSANDGAPLFTMEGMHLETRALVPIVTNACGGLLVAQVTYHAGPVKKGFAIVFGILVTSLAQQYMGSCHARVVLLLRSDQGNVHLMQGVCQPVLVQVCPLCQQDSGLRYQWC